MHIMHQDQYRIAVNPLGAELCSFLDTKTMVEYIWQADPQVWPRHAPVLFPIVGKLPENTYTYKGKTYHLSQHGFARDLRFTVVEETDNSLSFELQDSPGTHGQYPFPFLLQISYLLQANKLTVDYQVSNPGEEEMYFSIGMHPGFNCPLHAAERFTDYFLEFEQPETLVRHLLVKGLLNGETETVLENKNVLPLRDDLFAKDALVLKSFKSQYLTLKSNAHPNQVKIGFSGFPYLGIWSKPVGASFVCIEPWHGIAGTIGASADLAEKEGIIRLEPEADFACSYTIEVS